MKHLSITNNRIRLCYLGAGTLLLASAVLGVLLGASDYGAEALFRVLFLGETGGAAARIFFYVRFPRVAASLLCGAALAVSGAVIQGVLANRLASPSIIGVNAGAGLAVTVCSAFGILGGWRFSAAAFLGAFATALLVGLGAKRWGASRGTVILIGVAVNSLLGAAADAIVVFFPEVNIMRGDFKVGDFSAVTARVLLPAAVFVLLALPLLFSLSTRLDVLTMGDETAGGLGMNVDAYRVLFLLLAALLAGAAVSVCGLLSFVGLLVPHAVKRLVGSSARHLLPLSALLGAGFVTLCDTLARTLFAPYELPVGILLAAIGAPFFLLILLKGKGGAPHA